MTPEQEITAVVKGVCPQSGHWPYTRDADIYIGFIPVRETLSFSSSRVTGSVVEYDLVIFAKRGHAQEMETMRYRLYDALHAAGWYLADSPGPESYNRGTDQFMWPVTARKRFAMGPDGVPGTRGDKEGKS